MKLPRTTNLRRAYAASILLHGLALFLLVSGPRWQRQRAVVNNQPVEITVVETSIQPARLRTRQARQAPAAGLVQLPRWSNLIPQAMSGSVNNPSGAVVDHDSVGEFDPHTDNTAVPWGEGRGQFKRITEYNLMSRIHHQVEGVLYYPGVLAAHKVEGSVNVRLVLNGEGRCDWPRIQISSGSPYFRVFILDVVKKLCRQSYVHEVKGRHLTNVDLSFEFALTESDDPKIKDDQSHIVGNVLLFYRNSHHSLAEWRLGPLTGLFPLPFVNLDFAWLKENWETYVEHKDALKDFHEPKSEN